MDRSHLAVVAMLASWAPTIVGCSCEQSHPREPEDAGIRDSRSLGMVDGLGPSALDSSATDAAALDARERPDCGPPMHPTTATDVDFDGDGRADLLVGSVTGAVMFRGECDGIAPEPALILRGGPPGVIAGAFGASVAAAGDVNGDGYADAVVGAETYFVTTWEDAGVSGRETGPAQLHLGGPLGLASVPAWTRTSDDPQSHFANIVAAAGDVDGDGYADVLIAADAGRDDAGQRPGLAHVLRGRRDASAPVESILVGPDGDESRFAESLAPAGDVNGDGYADVIIGAPGAAEAGRAYLYLGSRDGLPSAPSVVIEAPEDAPRGFGSIVVGAGDLDGDGFDDLAVGAVETVWVAPGEGYVEGSVHVFLGSAEPASSMRRIALSAGAADGWSLGCGLARAGDIDGDGYGDLVVLRCERRGPGDPLHAHVHVFPGSETGPSVDRASTVTYERSTWPRLAGIGDVDADGYDDVAFGTLGAADIHFGGPTGLAPTPSWTYLSGDIHAYGFAGPRP